ncbi:hypothetical protein [Thermoanaerobacter sp. YS13]|uniref:hypothetical protein n=1 Tax=Thermoanaerobacter sp. YS13 TaxID=1511746 RepID=UPI0005B53EF7|nr:hypothetical protein [Thermoanaerobacter sp. YS13]
MEKIQISENNLKIIPEETPGVAIGNCIPNQPPIHGNGCFGAICGANCFGLICVWLGVLIVTNNYNYRRKYCYAKGGSYRLKIEDMSIEDAKEIIDYFIRNFDLIHTIQIFGGELMLNYSIINFICKYFNDLKRNNIISYMPRFGMVTNGGHFPEESIRIN